MWTATLEAFFVLPEEDAADTVRRRSKPHTVRSKVENNLWCSNQQAGQELLFVLEMRSQDQLRLQKTREPHFASLF